MVIKWGSPLRLALEVRFQMPSMVLVDGHSTLLDACIAQQNERKAPDLVHGMGFWCGAEELCQRASRAALWINVGLQGHATISSPGSGSLSTFLCDKTRRKAVYSVGSLSPPPDDTPTRERKTFS
jgi:hypothetical protein